MPTDLHDRATTQATALEQAAGAVTDALALARAEQHRRHPDPTTVARADWRTQFGAAQHVDVARAELAVVRAEQDRVRASLAAVATAADAETFEDELRALLVEDAALRVELRGADERLAAARSVVASTAELADAAARELGAAVGRTAWAAEHQALGEAARAALVQPPLDGIVAAATALQAGTAFTAAEDRLADLVPDDLRTRAAEREQEALDAVDDALAHHETVQGAAEDAARAAHPTATDVQLAIRTFLAAEDALRRYVASAASELEVAEALLARVAAHPDLSAAQAAALDAAANPDGVTAAGAERDLVAALGALRAAERAVEDAILDAVADDPDQDPETVAAVIAARDDLADAAVQQPVTDARAAYDAAAAGALDTWEVEVPASLWDAAADFHTARRILDRLSSAAARTALVDDLDGAQDDLADSLDLHDRAVRLGLSLGLVEAARRSAVAAATATAADRRLAYLRGDGPGGRTPTEL
jgi:hypothetical protein